MAKVRALPGKLSAGSPFPPDCAARFALVKQLGAGGFGAVYLARQLSLDRPAAVKVLLADILESTDQVERFVNEARITASIASPNVVNIYDHGAEYGIPWIAYEYLQGRSLRQILEFGGLTLETALDACAQVAGALEAAHARQVLHRDIKPDNVLEVEDGRFKVTDFGLAKWSREGAVKTATGIILGTPEYLAPEIIQGESPSPAADIYALGVMLFELTTGRVPFQGDSPVELLKKHLTQTAPPPSECRPGLPPALDRVVTRALARLPRERYASARALRLDLDTVRGHTARTASGARLPPSLPLGAVASADASGVTQVIARKPAAKRTLIVSREQGPRPGASPPAWPARLARLARPGIAIIAGTLVAIVVVAGIAWRRAVRPAGPAGVVEGSTVVAHRASGVSTPATPLSPAPSAPGTGEPQPTRPSPAAGYYTGGWKPYLALLPRLKAGGETAKRAVDTLRRSAHIELPPTIATWIHWIELNEWLADPRRPWPPGDTPRWTAADKSQIADGNFFFVDQAMRQLKSELTTKTAAAICEALMWGPEDGRIWLLLGRLLEMDGRPADARVAYTRGLEKLGHHPFKGPSFLVWDALARALFVCGGQTRLVRDFESYVDVHPGSGNVRPEDVLPGLEYAVSAEKIDGRVFTEFLSRFLKNPILGAVTYAKVGQRILYGSDSGVRDPDRALATWKEGLAQFPRDETLQTQIAEFHLERGDSTAALAAAEQLPQNSSIVPEIELVTMPDVRGSHRPDLSARPDHPSDLLPLLVYRLLEADDFEAATRELSAVDPGEFYAELIAPLLYDLLGHGIDRGWFATISEKALFGEVPDPNAIPLGQWTTASGEYATGAGIARMERLLGLARKRWTTYPANEDVQVVQALWLSRRGEDDAALGVLRAMAHPPYLLGYQFAELCEIASRAIWKKAMGDARAAGAAGAAITLPGPTYEPRAKLYWQALVTGDLAQAAALAQKLFYIYPEEPVWSLVLLWDAMRTGDRDAFRARLARARIANRQNHSGVWLLREMAALDKRFAAH